MKLTSRVSPTGRLVPWTAVWFDTLVTISCSHSLPVDSDQWPANKPPLHSPSDGLIPRALSETVELKLRCCNNNNRGGPIFYFNFHP